MMQKIQQNYTLNISTPIKLAKAKYLCAYLNTLFDMYQSIKYFHIKNYNVSFHIKWQYKQDVTNENLLMYNCKVMPKLVDL